MDHFLEHFYWISFCTNFLGTILSGGGCPLVLREGLGCSLLVLREGERPTVVTGGGVEDELLVRREGWEAVLLVNATN